MINITLKKEGFSLWAAVLQVFWALYHRMWLCSAALFFASMVFLALENNAILNESAMTVLRLGFFILVGYSANDWLRASMDKKGYEIFDVVYAKNLDEAKQRFYGEYTEEANKVVI